MCTILSNIVYANVETDAGRDNDIDNEVMDELSGFSYDARYPLVKCTFL